MHNWFYDFELELKQPKDHNKDFFKDYLVDASTPDISLSWTDSEILAEQDNSSECTFPVSYLETLAVLRKIAETLPHHNRLLIQYELLLPHKL